MTWTLLFKAFSTIFLDTPRTYTKSGVSKVFDNEYIKRVKKYENLKTQIIDYQSDGFRLSEKQHKFKEVIFENRFEKNNTERCCERIDKII